MPDLRIGFIGLDTSHVSAFAKLLNDPAHEHHVPGARVTVAYPGAGSPDFGLSINRVAGFTEELSRDRGVTMLESPEAVAEASDLIFITAVDGRVHRGLFEKVASFKKPVYIDKPLAVSVADAQAIVDGARRHGIPLMSCSSLRYAQHLAEALANGRDDVVGCDVYGPLAEEPTQPGFFWYGVHTVEMLVTAMGVGCREVRCVRAENHDALTATWGDGRIATIHGVRNAHGKFGVTLHRKDGPSYVDCSAGRPYYAGLVAAILETLPHGDSAIPADEMLHVVRIIEAANVSRANDGAAVAV